MRRSATFIGPRTVGIFLASLLALYAGMVGFGLNDGGLGQMIDVPLYTALEFAAAAFCLARPLVRPTNRGPWLAVGLGIACFAVGDAYFSFVVAEMDPIPYPSFADAGYIALYPLVYVGLGLLLRANAGRRTGASGSTVRLRASRSALSPLLFSSRPSSTPPGPGFWGNLTNLAYPLGDLGLMVMALATFGLTGWHIDRVWACALAGCAVFAVTDSVYLYQTAQGTYVQSTILDAGWPAGLLLFAMAAWQPTRPWSIGGSKAFASSSCRSASVC